ncbi:MAG: hypothetical protein H7301_10070 [Cryobacterium sp.]|nr:hypothetical protein [Oligoflexia bacterium]
MSKVSILLSSILTMAVMGACPRAVHATGGNIIPGSRFVSGRGAALGDAYIGLVDTVGESLFYNPAALGRIQDFTFEAFNLSLQGNSKLSSTFGTDTYKIQTLDGYESTLLKHPNMNPGGGVSLLPAIGFRGFGIGLLYQNRLMGETNGTNIRYRATYQLIPTVGYGLNLASGVLRIGYSLQWVNQASGDRTVAVGSRPLGWTEGLAQGKGFSQTVGLAVSLPFVYQPSINLVARNIGGLHLSGGTLIGLAKNSSGTLSDEKMTFDSSFGLTHKIGPSLKLSTQAAYRDLTNTSASRQISHAAFGAEASIVDRFSLRAGFGSGYPTAGLGVQTSRAEAHFAWYSEDLGNGKTPIRDIRYLFQIIFKAI